METKTKKKKRTKAKEEEEETEILSVELTSSQRSRSRSHAPQLATSGQQVTTPSSGSRVAPAGNSSPQCAPTGNLSPRGEEQPRPSRGSLIIPKGGGSNRKRASSAVGRDGRGPPLKSEPLSFGAGGVLSFEVDDSDKSDSRIRDKFHQFSARVMGGEKDREDKPQRNTAPGNEGSTHVGIENSSAILSSLTQYSRLIGEKYRRHLDAQREAREAALALSAALHEYGDVFDSPQVNKKNVGTCLKEVGNVIKSLEEEKMERRRKEITLMQHFNEIAEMDFEMHKESYNAAYTDYTVASERLREIGRKQKVKLEDIKQAEKDKSEKKEIYTKFTDSTIDLMRNAIFNENVYLLSNYSDWILAVLPVSLSTLPPSYELTFHRIEQNRELWSKFIGVEREQRKLELVEMKRQKELTTSFDKPNPQPVTKQPKPKPNDPLQPLQRIVEGFVRNERRFVHGIGTIQNLYLSELRAEVGLTSKEENKVFPKIKEIVDFHGKLLKAAEKMLNNFTSSSSNSPPLSIGKLFCDFFDLHTTDLYMEYSSRLLKSLELIGKKKDHWKVTCRQVKHRHDIEDITFLVQLPRNRLGYYIEFLSDYLEFKIPGVDLESEKKVALEAFHLICDLSDKLDRSETWREQLEKVHQTITSSPLLDEINLLQVPRRFLKKGRVEIKGRTPEQTPINYLVLCTDMLVCCYKDHLRGERVHVVTVPLTELEVAGEENQKSFTLGTPKGKWLVTSEDKVKGGWLSLLTSSIKTSILKLKLFGVPLQQVLRREQHCKVPQFLTQAFEMLQQNAKTEGIFRLSGVKSSIEELVAKLNMRKIVDFNEYDEHTVAGVLKRFFRELPTPLMTFNLYDDFQQCLVRIEDKPSAFKDVVMKLPEENRNVLTFLIGSLNLISKQEDVNKMSPHNLAIVFSPNLLRSPSVSSSFDLSESESKVVECLMVGYQKIFDEGEKELKRVEPSKDKEKIETKQGELEEEEEEEEEEEGGAGGELALGAVVKEGWLTKKGEVRKNWLKRWWVLKYGSLAYFKTQDGVNAAGRIRLVDCLVGQSTGKRPNCLAITTPQKRTFLIAANSPQEQIEWMQAIQGCIEFTS